MSLFNKQISQIWNQASLIHTKVPKSSKIWAFTKINLHLYIQKIRHKSKSGNISIPVQVRSVQVQIFHNISSPMVVPCSISQYHFCTAVAVLYTEIEHKLVNWLNQNSLLGSTNYWSLMNYYRNKAKATIELNVHRSAATIF
jgi:hypothetical protein